MSPSKKLILFYLLSSISSIFCMTRQIDMADAQLDFEKCIFNVHGIVRQVPQTYCSFIDHIKIKNDTSTLPLRMQDQLDTAGIILRGEAGVGKTKLAHFFAEVTNTPSAFIDLTTIISPYRGATAANIHKVFEAARQKARESHMTVVLIFEHIDRIAECDSIEYHSEYLEAYQQFCHEIDQSKKDGDIFIVGTTNHIRLCNPKFREKFTEITLVIPQNDNERAAALYGYLQRSLSMRAFTLEGIADFHQPTKAGLPQELHAPFDKLMQTLEQLTKKIITLEQNPMYLEFEAYSRGNRDIQELEELSAQLKQPAILFDPATVSDESLREICMHINKAIEFQVNKISLFLDKVPFLNENVAMIAHMTHGQNFRDLECLTIQLLSHPKQLTKEIVLTLINDISKDESIITNNTSLKRSYGKIIIPLLVAAAIGACEGFIEGVICGLIKECIVSKDCKKTAQETPDESESSEEDVLPEPA